MKKFIWNAIALVIIGWMLIERPDNLIAWIFLIMETALIWRKLFKN